MQVTSQQPVTIAQAAEKVAALVRSGADLESSVVAIVFKYRVGGHEACRAVDALARQILDAEITMEVR